MYTKNGRRVVIDDLERHDMRRSAISNLQQRISELDADMSRLQAVKFDGISVQGKKSTLEERLSAVIDEKTELVERLRKTKAQRKRIEKALEMLAPEEREILQKFYIERADNETKMDLCDEFGFERSELYRRKDKALEHLDFILYGDDPP